MFLTSLFYTVFFRARYINSKWKHFLTNPLFCVSYALLRGIMYAYDINILEHAGSSGKAADMYWVCAQFEPGLQHALF
jgi:hypothetical protein